MVMFLEEGGFPTYIARAGVTDLARTVNTAAHTLCTRSPALSLDRSTVKSDGPAT